MQFIVCVNNWYPLQYVVKKMLLNNSIGGTRFFLKATASREQTSTIPSIRAGGGGGLGAFANLKKAEHYPFCQMFYPDGIG